MSLEPQYILPLELLAIPVCLDQWQDDCLAASVCTRVFGLQAWSPCKGIKSPTLLMKTTKNAWTKTVRALCRLFQSTYSTGRVLQIWINGRNPGDPRILTLY